MELRQDVRESCRVCRSEQDNDFESLFTNVDGKLVLSAAGSLYEESLGIQIELHSEEFLPQYLCNSCELQMKLFQKLKIKARRTLKELKEQNDASVKRSQNNTECLQEIVEDEIGQGSKEESRDIEEYETQKEQCGASGKVVLQQNTEGLEEILEDEIGQSSIEEFEEFETEKEQYDHGAILYHEYDASVQKLQDNAESLEETTEDDEIGQNTKEEPRDLQEYETQREQCDASAKKSQNTEGLQEIIENEIGQSSKEELRDFEEYETQYLENENDIEIEDELKIEKTCYQEQDFLVEERRPSPTQENVTASNEGVQPQDIIELDKYDIVEYFHPDDKDVDIFEFYENSSVGVADNYSDYTEVYYLDDVVNEQDDSKKPLPLPKKKSPPDLKCYSCNSVFPNRTKLAEHRREIHSNQSPCPVCQKVMKTTYALQVHLQQHQGKPAYKCDLCAKTFNQKVHYKYHMDGHNNVRNFKCDLCEKAFLSKADLSTHTRSHTHDRRYSCDICGKSFLMLQHLKMHRYSHVVGKSFECEICKQKFVSPATLRTHMQTVHGDTRQHECQLCNKKFRRKHHLLAHYKIHQKTHILYEEDTENEDKLITADETDDISLIDADQIIYDANEDDYSDDSVLQSPYVII